MFDEDNLVSCAGLVPVMTLAEQTGLPRLLDEKVHITAPRIKSGAANPAPKLATAGRGHGAGADCIDDIDVLRSGGMKTLFDGVYAPSTVGTLLREFTFGHARQLESVLREHLVALCGRVDLLPGADAAGVHRHRFAAAPGLRARQTGRLLRAHQDRRQADPAQGTLAAGHHDQHPGRRTGDRRDAARAGQDRLRQGRRADGRPGDRHRPRRRSQRARSWCAATRPTATARWCGACVRARRPVLAGDDPQPGRRPGARRHRRGRRGPRCPIPARSAIPTPAPGSPMPRSPKSPTPLSHPPRTGSPPGWWCAGSRTPGSPTRCSRCGGITRSSPTPTYPSRQADITHRQHAIIETVFADLIDGPLAHIPSGRFGANSAWILCAAIAHNLLRAAGVLAGDRHTRARGSTLRRKIVNIPARLARPQHRPILHLPTHWPWSKALACTVAQHHRIQPTTTRDTLDHPPTQARPERTGKAGQTSSYLTPTPDDQDQQTPTTSHQRSVGGLKDRQGSPPRLFIEHAVGFPVRPRHTPPGRLFRLCPVSHLRELTADDQDHLVEG